MRVTRRYIHTHKHTYTHTRTHTHTHTRTRTHGMSGFANSNKSISHLYMCAMTVYTTYARTQMSHGMHMCARTSCLPTIIVQAPLYFESTTFPPANTPHPLLPPTLNDSLSRFYPLRLSACSNALLGAGQFVINTKF